MTGLTSATFERRRCKDVYLIVTANMNASDIPTGAAVTAGAPKRRPRKARPVTADPRARIEDAAIEAIGQKGFDAMTVSDVIGIAGVSRKTFYECFDDKRSCFLEVCERECERWLTTAKEASEGCDSAQDRPEAILRAIFEGALHRPATLQMLAFETASMRPDGVELRDKLLQGWGTLLADALQATHKKAPVSQRTLVVLLGGVLRTLRARLGDVSIRPRKPRRTQILGLVPELAEWIGRYSGPAPAPEASVDGELGILLGGRAPGTLATASKSSTRRGLPRGENPISRSFVVHSQRERILDAVANLSAAKGYASVTIPEIAQEAAISVQAFYEHFTGKEDTLLVAYEVGHRRALAAVERAYDSEADWPNAVQAAITALLCFLASEPSFAVLTLVDIGTASERAGALSNEGGTAYASMIGAGFASADFEEAPPQIAPEAISGALRELLYRSAVSERASELHNLVVEATWIALTPFIGSGAALAVAVGPRRASARAGVVDNGSAQNGAAKAGKRNGRAGSDKSGRKRAAAKRR